MPKITGFKDVNDLKYKIADNQTVKNKLAYFAHILGYGWCGGTQTDKVGYGFDVIYIGNQPEDRDLGKGDYLVEAHYDKDDPYSDGYWADKRLKMVLSNFRVKFDPEKMNYKMPPEITDLKPLTVSQYWAKNDGDSEDTASKSFDYELTETKTHSTSFKFTEGFKLSEEWSAGVPLFGGEKTTVEFSFTAEQGWTNSESSSVVTKDSESYTGKLPPHSKRLIELVALRQEGSLDYNANVKIEFNVKFYNFLRWSGNARNDHPEDRPFYLVTFGNDSKSAFEDIVDKYDHRNISGYSKWDWNWIEENFKSTLDNVINFFRNDPVTAEIPGQFSSIRGTNVEIKAHAPEPYDSKEEMLKLQAEEKAFKEGDLLLEHIVDEYPGIRVLD